MYVKENRPREKCATSFSDLSNLALVELQSIGRAVIVCGPITTGGRGSAEENIRAMKAAITHLKDQGHMVFDQFPYESTLWTLKDQWEMAGNQGYCMPILTDFYLPLYQSGLIHRAYFLPGWNSSYGAKWERKELTTLSVEIVDFEVELINSLLQEYDNLIG